MSATHPCFAFAPYRLSGVVYGVLLNDAVEVAALGDALHQPPYKAPPQAPVLQLKPRNTVAGEGDSIVVPVGVDALSIGATLGIVIGRTACRVAVAQALDFISGYTLVNDVSVPVPNHYRPSVRLRARDGFCPIGSMVVPAREVADADALAVVVHIDGHVAQRSSTAGRIRPVAQLLADVTEFMTLRPGDLLLLGAAANAPLARAGQMVSIQIDGLGRLTNHLVAAS